MVCKQLYRVDTDNHLMVLLHGVYDSKFERIIITKLDYIPLNRDIKYDNATKEFYIEETSNNIIFRTVVNLKILITFVIRVGLFLII
jgi:hypothetical protein